jgi:hypothetical protein
MKNIRDILDLKQKKSLRLGLLLLSTLFMISASALVYAKMIYEKALDVGNTGGVTAGSGSTASPEVGFTTATIVMLAVVAVVVGLSVFGFLREAFKHIRNAPGGLGSSPTGPAGIGLPLDLPSTQGEEWEESPAKEEGEE